MGEAIHQFVNAIDGAILGVLGEAGIAGGGENGMMAKKLLHLDQIDTGLDQVGCIAVAQAVGVDVFLRPMSATTCASSVVGACT